MFRAQIEKKTRARWKNRAKAQQLILESLSSNMQPPAIKISQDKLPTSEEMRERKREEAVLIGWSEPPQIGTVPARELLKKQAQDVIFKNKRHQALMEHII